jgi:pilus assembly protein CpaF
VGVRDLYKDLRRLQSVPALRMGKGDESTALAPSTPSGYESVKRALHQELLQRLDLGRVDLEKDPERFRQSVTGIVGRALESSQVPLTREERDRLVEDTLTEAVGLGPLGRFIEDPAVSDILVNGPYDVWVERFGKLEHTDVRFHDDAHLLGLIERIVGRVGRHIDHNSPMVDARLPDGSRVNAVIPPLSLVGPVLSIRRFGRGHLQPQDLVRLGTLPQALLAILEGVVQSRHNVQISGGTGSGKTTLLNTLSSFIGDRERIVTIEDAAELRLQKEHVVRLEARPPNIEGKGLVTIRQLVVNALRMRPDRIVVGEVRAGEAFDMLQAMSTGHDGSMTTVHANSARDSLKRLEAMVLMAGVELPAPAVRHIVAGALDVLVHVERLRDGTRRIVSVSEVTGLEKDTILTQDVFTFQQEPASGGKVSGRMVATGVVPNFLRRLELGGHRVDPALFQRGRSL